MNKKIIGNQLLYVAFAQRKIERKTQLASQYMQRVANMRLQKPNNLAGTMYAPSQGGYFISSGMPPRPSMAGMQGQIRNHSPHSNNVAGNQYVTMQNYVMPGGQFNQIHRPRNGMRPLSQGQPHSTRMPMQTQPSVRPNLAPNAGQPQYYQQYNPVVQQQMRHQPPESIRQTTGGIESISTYLLAQASDAQQKQMIGEKLYPRISRIAPNEDVGKITGTILQMDNSELLMILENDDLLKSKVVEATTVLFNSQREGKL